MKKKYLIKLCLFSFVLVFSLVFVQCGSKDKNAELKESLKILVETMNKQCPIKVDATMRLDSCGTKDTELIYFYTMTEDDIFDEEIFEEIGVPGIKENLKANTEIDFFRKNNISLRYIYSDNAGKKLYELALTADDLK